MSYENEITAVDMYGNVVKEGDIICYNYYSREVKRYQIKQSKVVLDDGFLRYVSYNNFLRTKIKPVNKDFWLKGCPQMQPTPDPELVKQFEDDLKYVNGNCFGLGARRRTITVPEMTDAQVMYSISEFLAKYSPYLQPPQPKQELTKEQKEAIVNELAELLEVQVQSATGSTPNINWEIVSKNALKYAKLFVNKYVTNVPTKHPTCASCKWLDYSLDTAFCANVPDNTQRLGLAHIGNTNKDYCSNHTPKTE